MAGIMGENRRIVSIPWWLVLLEGLALIVIGFLIIQNPIVLSLMLGYYWLFKGLLNLLSLAFDRSFWGLKLILGFLGIFAGMVVIFNPTVSLLITLTVLVVYVAINAIIMGIIDLIQAARGAGWGEAIFGLVNILLGAILLSAPILAGMSIPWVIGILSIVGGILAIFGAFSLRGAARRAKTMAEPVTTSKAAPTPAPSRSAGMPGEKSSAPPVTGEHEEAVSTAGTVAAAASTGAVGAMAAAESMVEKTAEIVEGSQPVVSEAVEQAVETVETETMPVEKAGQEMAAEATEAAAETIAEGGDEVADVASVAKASVAEASVAEASVAEASVAKAAVAEEKFDTGMEAVEDAWSEAKEEAAGMVEKPQETAAEFAAIVEDKEATQTEVVEEAAESETKSVEGMVEKAEEGAAGTMAAASEAGETAAQKIRDTDIFDTTDLEEMAKFSFDLKYIEGIGEVFAGKLHAIGISTPLHLLKEGATRKGREDIAERSGIDAKKILQWVNHCDLYRIRGVGSEYADLLEVAGVDTVMELAQRNAANLFQKMEAVNAEKALVRKLPTQSSVEDWVQQAKSMNRLIMY